MKKIFITGSEGFIGSHLVELLVKNNYDVKALVLYNSFNSWGWLDTLSENIKNSFEIVQGDIRDPHSMNKLIKGCDAVIHLAALIAIPYSYIAPEAYIDTNIKGTLNVLEAAKNHNVEKIIHTSTSEVYGTAQFVPITELHPIVGQSPYSASKIGADQIAFSYYASFKTPVTILRPFNTYGPRQSARAVIPTIITQIAKGYKKVRLGSVLPTRDFSYVEDTALGFLSSLKSNDISGETIQLGSNFEISVKDTAQLIAKIMNTSIEIEADDLRMRPENSEVNRLFASNAKAKEKLSWKPKYEGLKGFEEGLAQTIKWFKSEDNLGHYKANIYNT
jgi:NAD dependent epimerase/dehydratase